MKTVPLVIVALLIIGAVYYFFNQKPTTISVATPTVSAQNVKTFAVVASNYSFSLKEIKVNQGDRVKINFSNNDGFHDFVIDQFNVKTAQIGQGQTESVEFTADKKGTFEYYCSVGNHRAMGMRGNLVVE